MQELLGHGRDEVVAARRQSQRAKLRRALELGPVWQRCRRIDRRCALGRRATCRWRRNFRARSRADPSGRGSWRRPGCSDAAPGARGPTRPARRLLVLFSGGTLAGGGGGGAPRRLSRTHLPRSTGEVRVACEVTVRMLPWPSRPPPLARRASRDGSGCRRRSGCRSGGPAAR